MKKIVVIDGQGGKMGKSIVEQLVALGLGKENEIYAIGTNGNATAAMMKAGAHYGATGENPVIVSVRDADIVIGPIGFVIADSLSGEVTAPMATAVGRSPALKVLLPVNKCNTLIAGTKDCTMSDLIREAIEMVVAALTDTREIE